MYDVVIIGGGPSGLMASIEASKKYDKVLLIEKNKELGLKLKASGNGRCNVTNLKTNNDFIKNVQSKNSKFLLSALSEFGPWDIYDFFCDNNCLLKEEDDNRAFPDSDKSTDILNVLINNLGTTIVKLNESLLSVKKEDDFIIETTNGVYKSKNVILALGGKTYPNLGTTGDGYAILKSFDLKIEELYPALCALNSNDSIIVSKELQGITIDSDVYYNNKCYSGNVLFTHFGVSGPAIFKVSESVVRSLVNSKSESIIIDLIKDYELDELIVNTNLTFNEVLKDKVSNKVIKVLLNEYNNIKLSSVSKKVVVDVFNRFKQFNLSIYDSKGFSTAFVTSGGLSLDEVNPKTMEVKKVPGLYVLGELLDLHAYTGGYNITIALSTGYKAGKYV